MEVQQWQHYCETWRPKDQEALKPLLEALKPLLEAYSNQLNSAFNYMISNIGYLTFRKILRKSIRKVNAIIMIPPNGRNQANNIVNNLYNYSIMGGADKYECTVLEINWFCAENQANDMFNKFYNSFKGKFDEYRPTNIQINCLKQLCSRLTSIVKNEHSPNVRYEVCGLFHGNSESEYISDNYDIPYFSRRMMLMLLNYIGEQLKICITVIFPECYGYKLNNVSEEFTNLNIKKLTTEELPVTASSVDDNLHLSLEMLNFFLHLYSNTAENTQ